MPTLTLHSKDGSIKTVKAKHIRALYADKDENGKLVNVYEKRNPSNAQCHEHDYDEIDIIIASKD